MWPTSTKTPERVGDIQGYWTLQYLGPPWVCCDRIYLGIPPMAWIVYPGRVVLIVRHHL